MTTHWSNKLVELRACGPAIAWAHTVATPEQAWETCERGDWLLWIAAKLGADQRLVVRAACACARTALRFVPAGEGRPLRAIETTEAWSRGEATIEQVRASAADAADAAAYAANAATRRKESAAVAAVAAEDAADAADDIANAAFAATDAADAANPASRKGVLKRHADLVRRIISLKLVRL